MSFQALLFLGPFNFYHAWVPKREGSCSRKPYTKLNWKKIDSGNKKPIRSLAEIRPEHINRNPDDRSVAVLVGTVVARLFLFPLILLEQIIHAIKQSSQFKQIKTSNQTDKSNHPFGQCHQL
jgi:hypothetical protein